MAEKTQERNERKVGLPDASEKLTEAATSRGSGRRGGALGLCWVQTGRVLFWNDPTWSDVVSQLMF
ncbi:hypothetical protein Ancab_019561, partial [Ancistrocladus abbreviatus]